MDRSLWNLTSTLTALLLRSLSDFEAMQLFKLPILRLRDFTRSYHNMSYRLLKQGPGDKDKRLVNDVENHTYLSVYIETGPSVTPTFTNLVMRNRHLQYIIHSPWCPFSNSLSRDVPDWPVGHTVSYWVVRHVIHRFSSLSRRPHKWSHKFSHIQWVQKRWHLRHPFIDCWIPQSALVPVWFCHHNSVKCWSKLRQTHHCPPCCLSGEPVPEFPKVGLCSGEKFCV